MYAKPIIIDDHADIAIAADHALLGLVALFLAAWGAFILSDGDDDKGGEDCEALARAIALCPARTPEGLRAKASVIRARLLDGTVQELMDDVGADAADGRLIVSFAADALALAP